MKKLKWLTTLVLPTSLVPLMTTGCAKIDANQEIYESAIDYIKQIANIPHVSNDPDHRNSLKEMNKFLIDTASSYADPKTVETDDVGNVWFDLAPTKGYEETKKLVLQAHMDMVWAAQGEATEWDKWTHPCAPAVVETINGKQVIHGQDYLTNIGTDDSCGMAYMLAIAKHQYDFKHGPIRCVFTTNEENGEPGSEVLGRRRNKGDINVLDHNEGYDYLINIDSGPVGNVIFNAAGGYLGDFKTPTATTERIMGHEYTLSINKCLGGHSGANIGDGRINCLIPMAKMLSALLNTSNCQIFAFETPNCTGTSIPTDVIAHFISSMDETEIKAIVQPIFDEAKAEFADVETNMEMNLALNAESSMKDCLTVANAKAWFDFIPTIDYGVKQRYEDPDEHNAIKCSSNLGPLVIDFSSSADNDIWLHVAGRYQEKADLEQYKQDYDTLYTPIAQELGTNYTSGSWNPWDGGKNNPICNKCVDAYNEIGVEGIKGRVHGGLECADFVQFNENLNVVSLGPTNNNEHSVYETLELDTYLQFIQMMEKMYLKMEF